MSNLNYKTKVEIGVAIIVFLVGVFFIFQAMTIDTSRESVGPRTMPLFLAISLVIGGLWLGLRAFLGKVGEMKEDYGFLESDVARIFQVVACGALFVFLFWTFGYFIALIFTFISVLFVFGVRNFVAMIACGLVLAFIFQWLFMGVMRLNDPKGALVDLRPYTSWIAGN